MLQEDVVREIVARLSRGEGVKRIARELGIDRKTVKRWRTRGSWRPQRRRRRCRLETFRPFVDRRGPEIGWNAAVLHRELGALGFDGGYLQVQRYVKPRRDERRWAAVATVRFETAPGQQAQVDFGQLRVWIGERWETVHLFVCTLGYSRRRASRGVRARAARESGMSDIELFRELCSVVVPIRSFLSAPLGDAPRVESMNREAVPNHRDGVGWSASRQKRAHAEECSK